MTLTATPCSAKNRRVSVGLGPDPLLQADQGHGIERRRQLVVERRVAAGEQQDPHPRGREALDPAPQRIPFGQQHVRRAEHPRSVAGEGGAAPLAGGGERHRRGRRPAGVGAHLADGEQAGVRSRLGRREGAEGVQHPAVGALATGPLDAGHLQDALGEGAGLVDADDVDAGEHLHGRQLLHEGATPSQPDHADGEGHAGEQHQPLGDHRPDPGDRAAHAAGERVGAAHLGDDQQDPRGDERPGADPQDGVGALAQLGAHVREPLGLRRQARGVGGVADVGGGEATVAGHHEAAGAHSLARILLHRLALAAEQRLVHLELDGREHHAVHRDLVAGRDVDDVTGHDLLGGDLADRAVADDPHAGSAHHGEPVEGDLGSQLLDDADQGVGHQDDPEQRVPVLLGGQHHQQERPEDGVEAGEDVGAEDVVDGAAVVVGRDVDEAAGTLRRHLARPEPPFGVGPRGRGLQCGGHPPRMALARRSSAGTDHRDGAAACVTCTDRDPRLPRHRPARRPHRGGHRAARRDPPRAARSSRAR